MKLVLIKTNLKDGLVAVGGASGENQNLPILKSVLLEADDNRIQLTATNLEIATRYAILGKIIEGGKSAVPINILLGIINNLQSERLNLEKKNNNLEIKTDNYQAIIQGHNPEEFPLIPKTKNQEKFLEIKGEILKEAIQQVVVSAQFSDLRPELNGVLLHFSLDNLKIVATDSFRLSERTLTNNQFSSNHERDFKIIIPLKTINELVKVLKDDDAVQLYHDENQILVKTNQLEFTSRLIEDAFPDYTAIIPTKFETEAVVNRQELINALKVASVLGGKTNEVRIKILKEKKALEVFSADQATGENSYVLPAKINGAAREMRFNWRYLLDGLKTIKTENVFWGLSEDSKPALLKSPNETSHFYILMPIVKT